MWRGWIPIFIALHMAAFVFLGSIVADYHFVDPEKLSVVRKQESLDVVQVAAQLGRFDLVSLLLTVFGLVAVLGGLFAFGFVRGESSAVARATAEEVAERRLTDLLKEIRASMQEMREFGSRREQPSSKPKVTELEKAEPASENTEFDKG